METNFKQPKRKKATKADKQKRKDYLESKYYQCEICGYSNKMYVHVHHHLKQNKVYLEDESNYTALCMFNCHSWLHRSKSQFLREVKPAQGSKFEGWEPIDIYDYLHEVKS